METFIAMNLTYVLISIPAYFGPDISLGTVPLLTTKSIGGSRREVGCVARLRLPLGMLVQEIELGSVACV